MELEKELQARIFLHKVTIVKSVVACSYIAGEKAKGGIMLSEPNLEHNALEFADMTINNVLQRGMLNKAYEKAWDIVKDGMPDNYSIMGKTC